MEYKEGDTVFILAKVVFADEGDNTYQIDIDGGTQWVTPSCIVAGMKPKFHPGEPVIVYGETYPVDQINYAQRHKTFQYKVDGFWYSENVLEKIL